MSLMSLLLANTLTVCLVVALSLLLIYRFFKKTTETSDYNFPPGPRPLPIIGNLNILNMTMPQQTLHKLSEKYGNVYTFHMGPIKHLVLTGYEAVKEALVNQADVFGERGETVWHNKTSSGDGIIFGRGESWKTMRRFTLSTLRDFGMGKRSVESRITEECQKLIEVFKSHKGQPFDPKIIINSAVSNVICSIVFGDRFDYEDPQFLYLQVILNKNLQLVTSPQMQLYNIYPFLELFLPVQKQATKNIIDYRKFFKSVYHKRKDIVDSNELRSFVDTFISRQKEEEAKNSTTHFNERNMIVVSSNLFAAGTETTSTTLRWALLLMMKYPEVQEKVHREIDNVIGKERCPQFEDRKNMPYTDAVLHEIQRFSNVVPMNLLHQTAADTTFRGYRIPKGTPVIPLLTSVLYDKTQWATPNQFNPSHFLDTQGRFVKRDAFLPFSAGRRACLGENLAKMELFLFFTMLMQKFVFRPRSGVTQDQLDLSPTPGVTSAPEPYDLCAVIQ
ncbi:CP2K1 protein, partial [Polypterus senegalus]